MKSETAAGDIGGLCECTWFHNILQTASGGALDSAIGLRATTDHHRQR
jgi:hypothetical protein